jgi:20S proteasome subunit alpha 6
MRESTPRREDIASSSGSKRTLTDFRIVGVECPDLSWSWGVIKSTSSESKDEKKDEEDNEHGDTESEESVTAPAPPAPVPALPAPNATGIASLPPAPPPFTGFNNHPSKSSQANSRTTVAETSRIRIYFHSPVGMDLIGGGSGAARTGGGRGKRKMEEEEDGDVQRKKSFVSQDKTPDLTLALTAQDESKIGNEESKKIRVEDDGDLSMRDQTPLPPSADAAETEKAPSTTQTDTDEEEADLALHLEEGSGDSPGSRMDDQQRLPYAADDDSSSQIRVKDEADGINTAPDSSQVSAMDQTQDDFDQTLPEGVQTPGTESENQSVFRYPSTPTHPPVPLISVKRAASAVEGDSSQSTLAAGSSFSSSLGESSRSSGPERDVSVEPESISRSQSFSQSFSQSLSISQSPSKGKHPQHQPQRLSIPADSSELFTPSPNRISISYAGSSKRLVLDADIVDQLKIFRREGRIDIKVRLENADAVGPSVRGGAQSNAPESQVAGEDVESHSAGKENGDSVAGASSGQKMGNASAESSVDIQGLGLDLSAPSDVLQPSAGAGKDSKLPEVGGKCRGILASLIPSFRIHFVSPSRGG